MGDNTLSVAQVAQALNRDNQTIKYLLNNKMVSWDMAYRLPGSKRKSYLIYRDKFEAETGIKL